MKPLSPRPLRVLLVVLGLCIVVGFIGMSRLLVRGLTDREEGRMRLWAAATESLLASSDECDLSFVQSVIEDNRTIPLLLTDSAYNVLATRNVDDAGLTPGELRQMALRFAAKHTPLVISIPDAGSQFICYDDSELLYRLSYFPVLQVAVLVLFAVFVALVARIGSRSEKDKLWVGLSRETAHQLGTPISSLMAWVELLEARYADDPYLPEIRKDVGRLRVIADRFSRIGSRPDLQVVSLGDTVRSAVDYMRRRVSARVEVTFTVERDTPVALNVPLFEWVIENLCKNAVDAMDGVGRLQVRVSAQGSKASIEVEDDGKGMTKRVARRVFEPGFTTKRRGWGLGLPLVRRIVKEYHKGKITVARTGPGEGTVFRIELPAARG